MTTLTHPQTSDAEKLHGLRRWNAGLSLVHLGQALAILALASSFALPVTSSFLRMDSATNKLIAVPNELFRVRIGPLVAAFLIISAVAHAALSSPRVRAWYERNLTRGVQPARWIEYSLSSSLMMVVIAMLVGIYDIASLILILALNATMILFGWIMELHNQTSTRTNWTAYWFGCFAGIVPWIAVAIYLVGAKNPPGFVYAIYASIFAFFNIFALNMALQYRRVGRWRDYLYGERVYMLLSLFAKSVLAWQVFAGTLQPA
ncbi:MAG TPA: heliorhodopsin HeR [Solirubrobacteraceae bacterium]|nr:heliorhodopsin HeR [Solirubrobacteraceae bacterium]